MSIISKWLKINIHPVLVKLKRMLVILKNNTIQHFRFNIRYLFHNIINKIHNIV